MRTCQGVSEGEEGRLEVPDGAVSEARRFHEERGGRGVGYLCIIWRRVAIFMQRVWLVLRRLKRGVSESVQQVMPVLCV